MYILYTLAYAHTKLLKPFFSGTDYCLYPVCIGFDTDFFTSPAVSVTGTDVLHAIACIRYR
ncbi:MAG TPA: hypothetical protein DCG37_02180 [Lachnospiraceae bacterium]|nr:hypothetical protein [Lachnospiraceae bacterium]